MVKRVVRGSERPIGGSRGQMEGLRGQLEDLRASQRVWEASQVVWRVKLETQTEISNVWYHWSSTPSGLTPKRRTEVVREEAEVDDVEAIKQEERQNSDI